MSCFQFGGWGEIKESYTENLGMKQGNRVNLEA